MKIEDMIILLRQESFLQDLPQEYLPLIAGCAELAEYQEGEYLTHQNQPAECFYLLQKGLVSLRTNLPAQGNFPMETVVAPAALGWSWLVAPYKWYFDSVAVKPIKTIVVHTPSLLVEFEKDRVFSFGMYKRFMEVVIDRLHEVHMQMMDVYAKPEQSRI